jgi:hypothetical protein
MKGTAPLLAAFAFALAGCNSDSPVQADHHMHPGSLSMADLEKSSSAQTLDALRQLTAPLHDVDAALAAGYVLLTAPVTAPDGCISDVNQGGMGYHYTRGNNLADDSIALLDPEFIVYPPKNGPRKDGVARTRLGALEYFLPFTAKWPAPSDPSFKRAPTLHDFSTTNTLPDVAFAPTTRFGGWMFHIWLWENNPGGEFANWNTSVPLCQDSPF